MMADIESAKESGILRRDFGLSLGDSFIAQLAIKENLVLATLNKKDFEKIKEIRLLT
jgi:predicted nucleic acid-binding protein